MKKLLIILGIIVVAGVGYYFMRQPTSVVIQPTPTPSASDYKNASYTIEGVKVQLKNGIAESPVVGDSSETSTTEYFGNEVYGDFNGDGTQDVAFILTQSGAGTAGLFYVVAALKTSTGYTGTNAILLGDRIAPQTTEFNNGEIIVNYADRKPDEPYTVDPTVAVSKYLKVNGNKLIEVSP